MKPHVTYRALSLTRVQLFAKGYYLQSSCRKIATSNMEVLLRMTLLGDFD